MTALHRRLSAASALAALCLPLAAWADGPDDTGNPQRSFVIVGDRGETLSIGLDGSELTIVTRDDDGSTVRVVDMDQVGLLVRDGLQEALAAVRDMQFDIHMGRDNRLDFSHGDQTVEVDVDAIMATVGAALQEGLGDLDTRDWTAVRGRDRDMEQLRAQLGELKREVRRLQKELAEREP